MNHWDYSWPAMYSVTICTQNRECCLAEIKNGQVYLSKIGSIVFEELLKTPELRPYVLLDDFIIMPNHVHAIIVIKEVNDFGHTDGRGAMHRASTVRKFGPLQPKSLSSIMNAIKGAATRQCRKKGLNLSWQSNYYEHVIRDYEEFGRIRLYIAHNPINWENDSNNIR